MDSLLWDRFQEWIKFALSSARGSEHVRVGPRVPRQRPSRGVASARCSGEVRFQLKPQPGNPLFRPKGFNNLPRMFCPGLSCLALEGTQKCLSLSVECLGGGSEASRVGAATVHHHERARSICVERDGTQWDVLGFSKECLRSLVQEQALRERRPGPQVTGWKEGRGWGRLGSYRGIGPPHLPAWLLRKLHASFAHLLFSPWL